MAKFEKRSAIERLLNRFKATSNDVQRTQIVDEIAARVAPKKARKALMSLLAEEIVMDPPDKWQRELVYGAIIPDDWRNAAYRALVEDLCPTAEAFSFIRRMATENHDKKDCVEAIAKKEHRMEAIAKLPRYFAKHPETKRILMSCADNDIWPYARAIALECIVDTYADHPDARAYLLRAAERSHGLGSQGEAIRMLAKHHANHPETRPLLENLVARVEASDPGQRDPHSLRVIDAQKAAMAALGALAMYLPRNQDVFDLMMSRAKQVDDPLAGTACYALMTAYPDRSESVSVVMERARDGAEPNLRYTAVNALVRCEADDPRMLPFLLERVKKDEDYLPRCMAVEGLAARYADRPDAEAMVISRAASDPSQDVRRTAVKMLGEHFPGNSKARDRLISRLTKDRSQTVRLWARHALRQGFGGDPEAQHALKQAGFGVEKNRR